MSFIRKLMVTVILVICVGSLLYLIWNNSRTIYNTESTNGNTPGNIFNQGLFAALNDRIYFSNEDDDGALYSMDFDNKNLKKITTDKVSFINAAGPYIYYSRRNYKKNSNSSGLFSFNNVGIYRINSDGSHMKSLYDGPNEFINLYSNTLYYKHYKDGETAFYSIDIDGKNETKIFNESIMPLSIHGNTLYYAKVENTHNIYAMNLSTKNSSLISSEESYGVVLNNGYIYYLSIDNNYGIYRMNINGQNNTPLVTSRCSTFNMTADDKYLYYQVDDGKNNRICLLDLSTMEDTTLLEGNYKNINIAGVYVYFQKFEDNSWYYISIGDKKPVITPFSPGVIKK